MSVGLHVCSRSHHPRVSAIRHRVEDAPDRSEPPPTKTVPRGSSQAIFHEAVPRVLHPDIQEPHLSVRESRRAVHADGQRRPPPWRTCLTATPWTRRTKSWPPSSWPLPNSTWRSGCPSWTRGRRFSARPAWAKSSFPCSVSWPAKVSALHVRWWWKKVIVIFVQSTMF